MTVKHVIGMINDASRMITQLDDLARKYKMDDADRGVITGAIEIIDDYIMQLDQKEVK